MKKKMFLTLMLLTVVCVTSYSQCLSLIQNPVGNIWGYLDSNKVIYDDSSDKILDFSEAGYVKDAGGSVLATFNAETGVVLDQSNNLLITIEEDGDVLDELGTHKGHVDANGVLYDADNYMVVSIGGATPLCVAYYYFYYKFY